jgi:hypothetical protein
MTRITPGWASAMNRTAATLLGLSALLAAAPASAVTLDNGVVLITQADALAGNVTPGDAPGFPITLSVSGSYRFASNLLVNTAVDGIDVTAPEVTIDFAGFRMAGSGVGNFGIGQNQRALTVIGGTIRGFSFGIFANSGLTVNRMRIVDNGTGIVANDYATVSSSNISRGGGNGIQCIAFCRVENSIFSGWGFTGIQPLGLGSIVLGNTSSGNTNGINTSVVGVSFGDNTIVGNTNATTLGTTLPLDPNQPP